MGQKEAISASYMESQKALHAGKPIRQTARRAVVVGSNMHDNIGASIARLLKHDMSVLEPSEEQFDVTKYGQCNDYFRGRQLDVLVLSHGYTHLDWFEHAHYDDVAHTFNVNLLGTYLAAQAFVRATIDLPYAKHLVIIGSMAYNNVLNASAAYCASKAGVAMLVRCLAWELAPKGYSVFGVHPSNTEGTPMTEETIQGLMRVRGIDRATAEAYWGAVCPKAEWLQPENISDLVAFLVSGKGDYLSGCNLELRGGQR